MKRDVRVRLLEAEPDELRGVGDTEVARWVREDEDVRRCAATILRQTDLLNQTLASGNAEDSAIGIRVLTPFAMRERRRRARRAQSLAAVSLAAAALLTLLLTSRGATVRSASSAVEALEAIRARMPDVLLSDLLMPDEDGYWLIRQVRAHERERSERRLPAIALTAYASVGDRERAIGAGYDWHIAKPVDPDLLTRAISKVAADEYV